MRCGIRIVLFISLVLGVSLQASIVSAGKSAEAAQIDRQMDLTFKNLFENTPEAEIVQKEAESILVFPSIVAPWGCRHMSTGSGR